MSETNQNTSLTQAINDMRTMRESYDQLGAAAEAYNTGKTELAANINAKGVQASAAETLPELAEKVLDIQQTTTVIDGGDMYAAQLTGDGALWNLYDVLAQMKTQFMGAGQYAALIVCGYNKGYDSLQLQGADAYYTCDGDFYDTSMPLHVWHDDNIEKENRWVCFLFAVDGARLDITNTAISPRSMYIGGHIGTIEYFTSGRLIEFVSGVEETDVVDNLLLKYYTQEWNNNTTIKGVEEISGIVFGGSGLLCVNFPKEKNIAFQSEIIQSNVANVICINGIKKAVTHGNGALVSCTNNNLTALIAPDIEEIQGIYRSLADIDSNSIRKIDARSIKSYSANFGLVRLTNALNLDDIIVGEMVVSLSIGNWNPTTVLADADKKARLIDNIKNHILARVSDATGGTQLVFTISTNMYNAVASETIEWQGETMSLADAFLTKNWLLAGA